MSRKTAQRLCDDDMRKINGLKRWGLKRWAAKLGDCDAVRMGARKNKKAGNARLCVRFHRTSPPGAHAASSSVVGPRTGEAEGIIPSQAGLEVFRASHPSLLISI
jgi:hypothetical protein